MKKFILGLVLSFTLATAPVAPAHAFIDLGGISSGLSQIGGVVGQVGGIVSGIRGIFGGGGSSGGGFSGGSGLFDGDAPRIFEGGLQGGLNIGVDNIVSSGVVVVQDFDAIFESLQPGEGVTPTGEFVLPDPEKFNQIGENTSLRQYILNVLNFFLTFLGLIATAFIIYAGFLYVTSGGDDGNMEKAKKIILYAVIGILVILAAFAIVNTVIQNAGRGTGDRGEIPDNTGPTNVITTPGGTVIPVTTPGGTGTTGTTGSVVTSTLGSLVTVSGTGVQDFGNTAVVTPDAARSGVTFGLNTQGQALFDFGDGTQGILDTRDNPGATIVHPFGEERTYPIRVIIENVQGSVPVRKEVVVGGLEAKFTMNRAEITVGESLELNASGTQVTVGSVKSYGWACVGGTGCFGEGFGREASVSFTAPGEYTVILTVESVLGVTDTFSKNIRVVGGEPVANFSFSSTRNSQKPAEFTFNAGPSVNRSGGNSGLTYFWNFDGEFQQATSASMVYEFATPGPKEVELVVVENFRGDTLRSEAVSKTVEVETVIPVDFTVD